MRSGWERTGAGTFIFIAQNMLGKLRKQKDINVLNSSLMGVKETLKKISSLTLSHWDSVKLYEV